MSLLLCGLAAFVTTGALALTVSARPAAASWIGALGAALGSALLVVAGVSALAAAQPTQLVFSWSMPFGSGNIGLDGLSAVFLVIIGLVSGAAAIYGVQYLHAEQRRTSIASHWLFFNLLVFSMAGVVVARDGLLLLVAWELMSLCSFFLILWDGHKEETRRAAWIYLVATHIGTAFLLVGFMWLGTRAPSLAFADLAAAAPSLPSSLVFVLVLIGFGTKAGLMPVHVWLPEAHPAAPSHVSAVMSGVMLKTGVYGILRMVTLLRPLPAEWGPILIAVGATSGVLGVVYALIQHDLKRLLAYCSIENVGIITLGVGLGLMGQAHGMPVVSALGYAGALLHVVNHGLSKSLLFLGAGAVIKATGARHLDRMGGLLKTMPWTGATFLVAAIAISGLPPLNGFVSEFLLYFSAGSAAAGALLTPAAFSVVAILSLALTGGLAAACFAKAFGIAFLGEPRHVSSPAPREVGWLMRGPMLALAAACALVPILAPFLVAHASGAVCVMLAEPGQACLPELAPVLGPLTNVAGVGLGLALLSAVLLATRRWALRNRQVTTGPTWDCGYAVPNARMQYTASSFSQPLTDLFQLVLKTHKIVPRFASLFPQPEYAATHTPDAFAERLYAPAFASIRVALGRLRRIQQGRVQLYVLYVAATLLVLLILNAS